MEAFKTVNRKLCAKRRSLIKDLDFVLAAAVSSEGLVKGAFLVKKISYSLVGKRL